MYRSFFIFLLSTCFSAAISQDTIYDLFKFKDKYKLGETMIANGDFREAGYIFNELRFSDKTNANLCFKTGFCFLKAYMNKELALQYLKQAEKHISEDYKFGNWKERKAPVETYYYLGQAYHVNYKFKEAISCYKKLKSKVKDDAEFTEQINRDIEISKNAMDLVKHPVDIIETNLGKRVNTKYSEHSPVFTADESVFIFTSRRKGSVGGKMTDDGQYFEDIYISYNREGILSKPRNIGTNINTEAHEATIGLSIDGQQLFIYKDDGNNGNIYVSYLHENEWTVPEKMPDPINTRFQETHATLQADMKTLYFTSNRKGGFGGLDIYKSMLMPDGTWTKPENLGPEINTPYDEEGPFIHTDGKTLIFSSKGHNTMGGFDIFYSTLERGYWSEPVNIGYPINSTGEDVFFSSTPDGKRAYYSSYKAGGKGQTDIYMITFPQKKSNSIALVSGTVMSETGKIISDVRITVFNARTSGVQNVSTPNAKTGKYLFVLTPGDYHVTYEANGYLFHSEKLNVPDAAAYQEINKTVILEPVKVGKTRQNYLVEFEEKDTALDNSAKIELDKISTSMKQNEELIVEVPVDKASDESVNRHNSIVDYLVEKEVEKKRIYSKETDSLAEMNTLNLTVSDTIYKSLKEEEYVLNFDEDGTSLTEESRKEVEKLAEFLQNNEELSVEVLAVKPAENDDGESQYVVEFLEEKGIEKERIKTKYVDEKDITPVNTMQIVEKTETPEEIQERKQKIVQEKLQADLEEEQHTLADLHQENEQLNNEIRELKQSGAAEEEIEKKVKEREALDMKIMNQQDNIIALNDRINVKKTMASSGSVKIKIQSTDFDFSKHVIIESIMFDYGEHTTDDFNDNLDRLAAYLVKNPNTLIELRAYADSKSSAAFNLKLTQKRAEFVKQYLVHKGVNPQNLVTKGYGEDAPIALNINPDGTDNPEGRQYNRRVDIKVITSGDDMLVCEDILIPSYLDLRYTIVLTHGKNRLSRDYFYDVESISNISPVKRDGIYYYSAGSFSRKPEALKLLKSLPKDTFPDAFIINKFRLFRTDVPLMDNAGKLITSVENSALSDSLFYTIQLMALSNPVDIGYFSNLKKVQIYHCKDSLTRYTVGKYNNYEKARKDLKKIVKSGYPDAFIAKSDKFVQ